MIPTMKELQPNISAINSHSEANFTALNLLISITANSSGRTPKVVSTRVIVLSGMVGSHWQMPRVCKAPRGSQEGR